MNCKPGDLARVIAGKVEAELGIADRFIVVTHLTTTDSGRPAWEFEGPPMVCKCGCGTLFHAIADDILRPIRDPGDDAKDEMLRPLPKQRVVLTSRGVKA